MDLENGQILEGKVTGITKFGVFVSLDEKTTGMVHISEVSTEYVNDIKDFVTEGQTVRVKVLNTNNNGKIALSMSKAVAEEKKPKNFEEMLSKFKQASDEKIISLKHSNEAKRGGGSRRGSRK